MLVSLPEFCNGSQSNTTEQAIFLYCWYNIWFTDTYMICKVIFFLQNKLHKALIYYLRSCHWLMNDSSVVCTVISSRKGYCQRVRLTLT